MKEVQLVPNGPYARQISQWLGTTFAKIDISDPLSLWTVDALKLSTASITHLKRKFEELKQEARDLSDTDRRVGDPSRGWYNGCSVSASNAKSRHPSCDRPVGMGWGSEPNAHRSDRFRCVGWIKAIPENERRIYINET